MGLGCEEGDTPVPTPQNFLRLIFKMVHFGAFQKALLTMCSARHMTTNTVAVAFYRVMHYSAKRGIEIACRLSVRLSVCLWQ